MYVNNDNYFNFRMNTFLYLSGMSLLKGFYFYFIFYFFLSFKRVSLSLVYGSAEVDLAKGSFLMPLDVPGFLMPTGTGATQTSEMR